MAAPQITLSVLVIALLTCSVTAYPNGKVPMSCGGMIPQHNHSPQSEPIHQITVSQTTFKPGDQIKVQCLRVWEQEVLCQESFEL
uniref:Ferric-chelate reductase 1 n=1 Tax=Mus musculus TaxID=10090 RepID=A0A0G2JGF6_MOUSE